MLVRLIWILSSMSVIWMALLVGFAGVLMGSFVNAVIFRSQSKESLWSRSKCRSCAVPIHPKDLVPIVSYFALKRRCRSCKAEIEWQYPVIELAMGVMFALLYARVMFGVGIPDFVDDGELFVLLLRDLIAAVFLVIIFVIDLKYSVILDRFSIPALLFALLLNVHLGADPAMLLLAGLLIGGFFAFQYIVSKGAWIGGGDVRMGMFMGCLLGVWHGVLALFLAYVIGAIVGLVLIARHRKSLKSHIPFGTFLAFTTFIVMIWGEDLLIWYLGLI